MKEPVVFVITIEREQSDQVDRAGVRHRVAVPFETYRRDVPEAFEHEIRLAVKALLKLPDKKP